MLPHSYKILFIVFKVIDYFEISIIKNTYIQRIHNYRLKVIDLYVLFFYITTLY